MNGYFLGFSCNRILNYRIRKVVLKTLENYVVTPLDMQHWNWNEQCDEFYEKNTNKAWKTLFRFIWISFVCFMFQPTLHWKRYIPIICKTTRNIILEYYANNIFFGILWGLVIYSLTIVNSDSHISPNLRFLCFILACEWKENTVKHIIMSHESNRKNRIHVFVRI